LCRVTYSHGMADDNCNVDISRHTLDKHERDVAKYVGQEFLHILRRCVEIIFNGEGRIQSQRGGGMLRGSAESQW